MYPTPRAVRTRRRRECQEVHDFIDGSTKTVDQKVSQEVEAEHGLLDTAKDAVF